MIITFLYHTGLRISELISIKQEDIRSNGVYDFIKIIGKGDKVRELKCKKELLQKIQAEFQGQKYLFATKPWKNGRQGGKPLDRHKRDQRNKKGREKASEKRHLQPLITPRVCDTHLINDGKNIKAVSDYLGHSSVKTTLDLYVHDHLELVGNIICRCR